MKKLYVMLVGVLVALGCRVSEAQLPAHLMHSVPNPNAAGDCYAIRSFTPSVGVVGGDSGTPCTPVFLTSAYTNSTTGYTAVLTLPGTQAATTISGKCVFTWTDSSTSGTVTFAAGLSAAPTDLWMTAVPASGAFVAPTYTTITSTTQTAITGALATATANTPYQVKLSFVLANASAANTLTIYAVSNSASDVVTVEPGSSCVWMP
jgi:hypothetical protein